MSSHIFKKLNESRRNPSIFDHISKKNHQSGEGTRIQSLGALFTKNLTLSTQCQSCQKRGSIPKDAKDIPFSHLVITCPHCESTIIKQDIVPLDDAKQPYFKTTESKDPLPVPAPTTKRRRNTSEKNKY